MPCCPAAVQFVSLQRSWKSHEKFMKNVLKVMEFDFENCVGTLKATTACQTCKPSFLNKLASDEEALACNCWKTSCPLDGKCCERAIIYKAYIITPDNKTMSYYGCCETDFKVSL